MPAGLRRLLVQWADESTRKTVGPEPRFCTGVPGTFNFDSFGYNSAVLKKQPGALSWAELVNRRWQGRVGLNGFDPQTGLQDAANAVQAAGLIGFGKPADQAYSDPFGDPAVAKARIRDGGSFATRACRLSSWNSTPRQEQYFLERWQQFLSSF